MTFTVTVNSVCSGGNHLHCTLTVGGNSYPLTLSRDDLNVDYTREEALEAIVARLRSKVKEASASTYNQIKTALEGQTFKI